MPLLPFELAVPEVELDDEDELVPDMTDKKFQPEVGLAWLTKAARQRWREECVGVAWLERKAGWPGGGVWLEIEVWLTFGWWVGVLVVHLVWDKDRSTSKSLSVASPVASIRGLRPQDEAQTSVPGGRLGFRRRSFSGRRHGAATLKSFVDDRRIADSILPTAPPPTTPPDRRSFAIYQQLWRCGRSGGAIFRKYSRLARLSRLGKNASPRKNFFRTSLQRASQHRRQSDTFLPQTNRWHPECLLPHAKTPHRCHGRR